MVETCHNGTLNGLKLCEMFAVKGFYVQKRLRAKFGATALSELDGGKYHSTSLSETTCHEYIHAGLDTFSCLPS